ncbi:Crp/Fnr family transcriptional regulator [Olivibacter sp. SDN3]|uniref:Crp/Fnr family transcriptional regulator n=1 Tax=Olivibacter sp. SDN3 TaxID=2764720 RepID=UPI0016517DBD|nr:Crp/Fnr family transcriptional regulator [Olivibacter sp. SDN3]QNL52314.1 Crp/Fnr family transcriptional regulator [Olivibacter sp. SDN3]
MEESSKLFDVFINYLKENIPVSDKELSAIISAATTKTLRKWQSILHDGEVWRKMVFISEGCCRLFRYDGKGADHTVRFGIENWWMTDLESFNADRPSQYNIEALAATKIIAWSKKDWMQLQEEIPAFKRFYEQLVLRAFEATQERVYTLISQTPEEKYLDFQKKYPLVFDKVPLHMVASYLGISRETLSRVRKELVKPSKKG